MSPKCNGSGKSRVQVKSKSGTFKLKSTVQVRHRSLTRVKSKSRTLQVKIKSGFKYNIISMSNVSTCYSNKHLSVYILSFADKIRDENEAVSRAHDTKTLSFLCETRSKRCNVHGLETETIKHRWIEYT